MDKLQRVRMTIDAGIKAYQAEQLTEAETILRNVLPTVSDPERAVAEWALGVTLLTGGNLNEGFRYFDSWRRAPGAKPAKLPGFPPWTGQDVGGKHLLIWSEDGLGDQIMYARFAVELIGRGATVSWVCPPSLVRLLKSAGINAVASDKPAGLDKVDFCCTSTALPLAFDLSLENLPSEAYIPAPPSRLNLGRIGIKSHGNPAHIRDSERSLDEAAAQRLLALPKTIDLSPEFTGATDFYETAAIITGLNLVITVDTSIAHLAGSMGKPVWILLGSTGTDWRWLRDRPDSPWYPSASLFRKAPYELWSDVINRVEHGLSDAS